MDKVENAIQKACATDFGVLDRKFLCQSVSQLKLKDAISVSENATLDEVVTILQSKKIGCVSVIDHQGKIVGIFSERDFLLKVPNHHIDLKTTLVSSIMTKNPVVQPPDATVAFVLTLMSQGGFRHLPIVDGEQCPIFMLSVKDVVDHIVETMVEGLLAL